jgi:hypothetical protein
LSQESIVIIYHGSAMNPFFRLIYYVSLISNLTRFRRGEVSHTFVKECPIRAGVGVELLSHGRNDESEHGIVC